MKGYPSWFRSLLLGVAFVLTVSGLLLAPTTLVVRLDLDLPWRLNGVQRDLTAALHLAMAFLLAMALGALSTLHVRIGWRRHHNRRSGAGLMGSIVALAATGIGIYYLRNESIANFAAISHLGIGLLVSVVFVLHLRGKLDSSRRRSASRPVS